MKVILQILNGQLSGQRFCIDRGERLTVGSGDEADLRIPGDPRLALVHFQIECEAAAAKITSLARREQVIVNGRGVTQKTLLDSDVLQAGSTQFRVGLVVRSGSPVPKPIILRSSSLAATERTGFFSTGGNPGSGISFPYTRHKMASGLIRYSGNRSQFTELDVARFVEREFGMYLVVRQDPSQDQNDKNAGALDHWGKNPGSYDFVGSRLIAPQSSNDGLLLLKRTWNRNAVCGLFSRGAPDRMLDLVAKCGFLTLPPEHLRLQLELSQSPSLQACFLDLAAVLIELNADRWGLYVSPEHPIDWEQLGFPRPPMHLSREELGSDSNWSSWIA